MSQSNWTQVGLALDEELCSQNLERILARAGNMGILYALTWKIRLYRNKPIRLYRQMRAQGLPTNRFGNSGLPLPVQERFEELQSDATRIRLVKGAYNEPADLAFSKKKPTWTPNFDLLARETGRCCPGCRLAQFQHGWANPTIPAFGTHDQKRIQFVKEYAAKVGLPKKAMEFQMLYAIRRDLQTQCVSEGYPVRIYVPYGTHWYPYFMRRLAERPANMWVLYFKFLQKISDYPNQTINFIVVKT